MPTLPVTHIKHNRYSWGTLTVLEAGPSFSVILHGAKDAYDRSDLERVVGLGLGSCYGFEDETGTFWTANRSGDGEVVEFHRVGGASCAVRYAHLLAAIKR